MSLIKHSPMSSLFGPVNSFNGFLDHFFDSPLSQPSAGFLNPITDVTETDQGFSIRSEMPGVDKDNIKLDLHDGVLTISAEKTEDEERKKEEKVVWRERRHGQFVRRFNLGDTVDAEHISANFKDGVLLIEIGKTGVAPPKTKTIPIG